VLRSIFGQALDDGLIVRNPAAKVQASGTAPKQRQALSGGDRATLRAHVAGDRLGAMWCLTLAGLRRSEILALRWADVDLSAGTVTVSRSITADASGRRGAPTGTRTHSGARCLPLVGDVVALLSTLRADHGAARHTSVTTLRAAGVSDDVVGAWHGHDETIMRAVYSHPPRWRWCPPGAPCQTCSAETR